MKQYIKSYLEEKQNDLISDYECTQSDYHITDEILGIIDSGDLEEWIDIYEV